jgi:hypothetical protein
MSDENTESCQKSSNKKVKKSSKIVKIIYSISFHSLLILKIKKWDQL